MNETRTIFFIGKPGCGKGTQAKFLSQQTGWPAVSSGKLFRQIATQDTAVGHKVKEENDAGLLQPPWFAMHLYLSELFKLPENGSAIFDGFNRKIQEAQLIVDSLKWLGRPFTVIHLTVSDAHVHERLNKRKEIEGRADDNVVDERLKEYHEFTEPAIELFRASGTLIEIGGERAPEEISKEIAAALKIA